MLVTSDDYRRAAKKRLPRLLFDYIDGGSYAERTLRANVSDFADVQLRQRVLNDVSTLNTSVELFGQKLSMPLVLAPIGMGGMFSKRGEVQAARAAKKAGVPLCLSTLSICGIEEVTKAAVAPWFQLYVLKDRGYMRALIARAKQAGCPVLVFTVDLPVPGARYRDMRSGLFGGGPSAGFKLAWDGLTHPGWLWDVWLGGRPNSFSNVVEAVGAKVSFRDFWVWVRENFDPTLNWKDLDWIREAWGGPIVIKGILDPEDARQACGLGIDGIVVSNHGGRQLDDVLSGIRALPPIVDAVAGRTSILMDGGVRSGLDVMKAMALGAKACLIGRNWVFASAAQGERGVANMLNIMRGELRTAMALTGCTDVTKASPEMVTRQS
ncbi:MAG TPA: L-lactate dehydrogenase [Hyphomonadaceae bacterium]|nr:L-lactate dehydrogenase [Hyphomonadaceae bacterium]